MITTGRSQSRVWSRRRGYWLWRLIAAHVVERRKASLLNEARRGRPVTYRRPGHLADGRAMIERTNELSCRFERGLSALHRGRESEVTPAFAVKPLHTVPEQQGVRKRLLPLEWVQTFGLTVAARDCFPNRRANDHAASLSGNAHLCSSPQGFRFMRPPERLLKPTAYLHRKQKEASLLFDQS